MKYLLTLILVAGSLAAQSFTIKTVLGSGAPVFSGDGGPATAARLVAPEYTAVDASGNTYFSDSSYAQVFRVDAQGVIAVVAGTGTSGYSGDEGPATEAQLAYPLGLALDSAGNLYIADYWGWCVRVVTTDGIIHTFAGSGDGGATGDSGAATDAALQNPVGLAFDGNGNLYITQYTQNVVRKIDPSGMISTVAGTGVAGYAGDGKSALAAKLNGPQAVAADAVGNVYFSDNNYLVRRIGTDGNISTFAGNLTSTNLGDGGVATKAAFSYIYGLAVAADGTVLVADSGHFRVRSINAAGVVTTIAGSGTAFEDGKALSAEVAFPVGLAVDPVGGGLVMAEQGTRRVRYLTPDGTVSTMAGFLGSPNIDGASALSVSILDIYGVAVDPFGNVYVSGANDDMIFKVKSDGTASAFAGNGLPMPPPVGGRATALGFPWGLSFDPVGNLLVGSGFNETVFRLDRQAISNPVAGGNGASNGGDGGSALQASIGNPTFALDDTKGGFFISDVQNNQIRHVDAKGIITLFAGNGTKDSSGDGGPALKAALSRPSQLALDASGNLYIAEFGSGRIRMVTPAGFISTVVGKGKGKGDSSGDDGPAVAASITTANGIAIDKVNNRLFLSDDVFIRMVDLKTGIITTVAGSTWGDSGDGGSALSAQIGAPFYLAVDATGNVYFTDTDNYKAYELVLQLGGGAAEAVHTSAKEQAPRNGKGCTGKDLFRPRTLHCGVPPKPAVPAPAPQKS